MGDINTLKNVLLFAVKNNCKEIHLSAGRLPLLIDHSGQTKYLNGVLPMDKELLEEISKRYISNDENVITTIGEEEFLLMKMGDALVFRHLCFVDPPKIVDTVLSSACYSAHGLILITSRSAELRSLHSYMTAAYLTSSRNITMAVIEKYKSYKIKESGSNIINIYNPNVELDVLLRITGQLSYDCLLVPDCPTEQALGVLSTLAHDKLVIAGTTPETAKTMARADILCLMNIGEDGTVSKKTDPGHKINTNFIIQSLRG
jgi:hypothetical protein